MGEKELILSKGLLGDTNLVRDYGREGTYSLERALGRFKSRGGIWERKKSYFGELVYLIEKCAKNPGNAISTHI